MRRILAFLSRFSGERVFRVIYPDGKRTLLLRWDEAEGNRAFFGGTTIYDPPPQ